MKTLCRLTATPTNVFILSIPSNPVILSKTTNAKHKTTYEFCRQKGLKRQNSPRQKEGRPSQPLAA
jgi:hypothetical protein